MWRYLAFALALLAGIQDAQAIIVSASLSHAGQALTRKGQWYRFRLGHLPQDSPGQVTGLRWQIHSLTPWPQPPLLLLCHDSDCHRLDSVAGRSHHFATQPSQGEWSVFIALTGAGAQQPPLQVTGISLTVDMDVRNKSYSSLYYPDRE